MMTIGNGKPSNQNNTAFILHFLFCQRSDILVYRS